MEKEMIPILTGFGGVALGGFISFIVAYAKMRHDEKLEKRKLYSQKLEQMYCILNELGRMFYFLFEERRLFIENPDRRIPDRDVDYIPIDKLKMLIDFYAPKLSYSFDSMNKSLQLYKGAIENSKDSRQILIIKKEELTGILQNTYNDLSESCENMRKELIMISKYFL